MKKLLLLLTLAFNITINAQDDKTVILTVSGQGKTQDEAKQKALRSAIEQAFGTFISSKTEILNDNLVKDEIVSVTNGNIQKYDVLSETVLPNGGYATTLKAIVSVSKLTSFCESKGVEVEFKGSTFAMNIKLQKLNEEAENSAIINLCKVSNEILSKSIDYSLKVSEPVSYKGLSSYDQLPPDLYLINFDVDCKSNQNYDIYEKYFWKTISSVAMGEEDVLSYKKINKPIYYVVKYTGQRPTAQDSLPLRSLISMLAIKKFFLKANNYLLNFRIISEIDTIYVKRCCRSWGQNTSNTEIAGGSRYEDEKWSLNFQQGFPASATLRRQCMAYSKTVITGKSPYKECQTTSGSSYQELLLKKLGQNEQLDFLFNDKNIYFENSDHNTNDYFRGEYNSAENQIFIYYQPGQYSFTQKYRHILPLSKLEKISKYVVQPWENKE
jgi:hypothetical protein